MRLHFAFAALLPYFSIHVASALDESINLRKLNSVRGGGTPFNQADEEAFGEKMRAEGKQLDNPFDDSDGYAFQDQVNALETKNSEKAEQPPALQGSAFEARRLSLVRERSHSAQLELDNKVYYELRLVGGYCLDIPRADTRNGIDLIVWDCKQSDNQLWFIDDKGYIRSKLNYNKCIDPQGPSTANGSPVQLWDCEDDFTFHLWSIHSGRISSKQSPGQCIAAPESKREGKVHMWECGDTHTQNWSLITDAVALTLNIDAGCPARKTVTMYKFCIQGDNDAGANGEHRLKLDGNWLYPEFRNYREGQCHEINVGGRAVDSYKSLTVGTEEHDTWSENDSYLATMTASQWYNPTCETYEVVLAKEHKHEMEKSVCWNLSAGAEIKGVQIGAGAESCTSWTEPADSFIWYMEIKPAY